MLITFKPEKTFIKKLKQKVDNKIDSNFIGPRISAYFAEAKRATISPH